MADLVSYGNADRDIEQALTTLKKGSQLLKYGRKGKPKFCQFRLSNDESSLIWISSNGERSLKLTSVSRIIPGQRTPVFRRYLRPEKDYLSFSLIYNEGKRSLDLICKDKVEAESWIAGIRALLSSGHGGRSKIDGWSDGSICLEDSRDSRDLTSTSRDSRDLASNSRDSRDLASSSPSSSSVSATQDTITPANVGVGLNTVTSPTILLPENPVNFERSHASSETTTMQAKLSGSDVLRVSVSSAPSTSSHSSQPDDCDALADVYIWGEVICDSVLKVGPDKNANFLSNRADILVPRPLESNVVLDVHHIACGVRHAALVTKQGEVFTWGEESGGRLGHGVAKDVVQPRLVESLGFTNFESITCGEFHTCAVTVTGELYTWGDGTHNAGLLGNGTDVSHWIPKRISGPLEGISIGFVSCGPWHTAVITSAGQLFTFGDGTFGVLGHGDRQNVLSPREVESLSGLKTVAVSCGVWHTAAIVEVIVTQSSSSTTSGKLFTWGDGDKNRLGHGDKDARLEPTCVPFLIEHNFHKISCGHSITVGLTTSGRVFTMGSTVYGQLGNASADGKLPCLVGDRLGSECVEEISCGAYHVAVLTSRNEVYTWGKGANGRLGHGDVEDRKTPTLVESLKDRHVKFIASGSNYTAAICLHKWVSGAEQSQCSSCRLAFGFTRKRHNCYNCGLVHCHSCSSKKAVRAALAPNPRKPYRVCDSCYTKLNKVLESNINSRKSVGPRLSGENRDRIDKADLRLSKSFVPSNIDLIKQLDSKAARQGKKADTFSLVRASQTPSLLQLKDVSVFSKPYAPSGVSSRSVSPFSRRPSPPRSVTPIPTTAGLSKGITESLKKTNELLNQEVMMLRSQVERLRLKCEQQEVEIQRSAKRAQEATAMAADESAKSRAAKEVIKSLTAQLRDMAERLPSGNYDTADRSTSALSPKTGTDFNGANDYPDSSSESHSRSNSFLPNGFLNHNRPPRDIYGSDRRASNGGDESSLRLQVSLQVSTSNGSQMSEVRELGPYQQDGENGRSRNLGVNGGGNDSSGNNNALVDAEWIEQYEPGVYITLVALRDGTRDLKRVRFSRRRFGEHQAETWWSENRERVYEKYNVRGSDKSSVSGQTSARRFEGATSPAPSWVGPT